MQRQERDYEDRMETYALMLENYGRSMENVVTVMENDVYVRKLVSRNTFEWDSTTVIAERIYPVLQEMLELEG